MSTQIQHNFQYHPTTSTTVDHHSIIRQAAKELALKIDQLLPADAGREKAIAITKCEEAMMWACAGILRHPGTANPQQL